MGAAVTAADFRRPPNNDPTPHLRVSHAPPYEFSDAETEVVKGVVASCCGRTEMVHAGSMLFFSFPDAESAATAAIALRAASGRPASRGGSCCSADGGEDGRALCPLPLLDLRFCLRQEEKVRAWLGGSGPLPGFSWAAQRAHSCRHLPAGLLHASSAGLTGLAGLHAHLQGHPEALLLSQRRHRPQALGHTTLNRRTMASGRPTPSPAATRSAYPGCSWCPTSSRQRRSRSC
jgi:hypothetical protein